MFILLIYDISSSPSNLNRVRKISTKYLFHIQYSVFKGELSTIDLLKLKSEILKTIDVELDNVMIFTSIKEFSLDSLGIEKNNFTDFTI